MVRKIVLILFIFLDTAFLFAQEFSNTDLQSLVNTERAFAKLAKDSNTRTAFLTYLADESVTFGGGHAQNGRKQYEKMIKNESLLSWEPIYADIAASGDFGYDTGPWEYRHKRSDDKSSAYGDFVSIWKKQSDGTWKVFLDIGISHPQPNVEKPVFTTSAISLKNIQQSDKIDFKTELINKEKDFITSFSKSGTFAYSAFISRGARFYRTGLMPLTTSIAIQEILEEQNNKRQINYNIVDSSVASSGDLGYLYGTAIIEYLDSGSKQVHQANYLRIWKKEDGKNWKIVVDLIAEH